MVSLRSNPLHRPGHILLVDDNSHGLAARRSVLEELGYSIFASASAEEALSLFEQEEFDLVITDYKLPGLSGVHLIQQLKRKAPGLPVILISGFVDTLGLDEKSTGADVVIQKSANEVSHLLRAVARLLKGLAPRKPAAAHRPAMKSKRQSV